MKTSIVIIEDEPDISEVIEYNLTREGFEVASFTRGDKGLNAVRQQLPALVILDLMLPGIDGLSVCQQIKSDRRTKDVSIIIVSAKVEETDVVIGLGHGADDYLRKPFSPRELISRVKAVLRRSETIPGSSDLSKDIITIGELTIDPQSYLVKIGSIPVELTMTEFKILFQLSSGPGRVYTRQQILEDALFQSGHVLDRNIDVHVRAIRQKLGPYGGMIVTVRGIGYRFSDTSL